MMRTQDLTEAVARPRLLVIEDEKTIGDLAASLATESGFDASAIQHPVELGYTKIAKMDVVVIDLSMPDVDGIEVIRSLGEYNSRARLVILSGLESRLLEAARKVAQAYGLVVSKVVKKPFLPHQLRRDFGELADGDYRQHALSQTAKAPLAVTHDELARAIANNEFVVFYQPQISLADNLICGLEVLVRWQHPTRGLLYPDAFIEMVERAGLAYPFSYDILRRALSDARLISDLFGFRGTFSFNMPLAALADVKFPECLSEMSTYTGVDLSRITLEVSGGAAIVESAVPMDIQSRLRMRGVGLSLEEANVGGVSGIELIKHFPFTEIKMDLRALHALDHYDASSRVIQHIIDLAHSMQVKVVATGIETLSSLAQLRMMRCDILQGHCISRPIPLGELIPWMKKNFVATAATSTALPSHVGIDNILSYP